MFEFLKELEIMGWFSDMTSSLTIIVYVLQALALYTIAKRRCIKKPWLAWIPIADVWILGSISDQYQYVVKGAVKNKRKTLLILNIMMTVLCVVLVGVLVMAVLALMFYGLDPMNIIEDSASWMEQPIEMESLFEDMGTLLFLLVWLILLMVFAIWYAVVRWQAVYDVFRSCDPNNSVVYLLVSLFGNFVIEGIYSVFLLICKEKDLGMPPRKTEPEIIVEPIVENPTE